MPEWRNFLAGLWLIAAAPMLGEKQKALVSTAVRICVWVLLALAWYQKFYYGEISPSASLVNPNAYASFLLMAIPLAFLWKDWPLLMFSLPALFWSGSYGAWMALLITAALAVNEKSAGSRHFTGICAALSVVFILGLSVVLTKYHFSSISDRLIWWESALKMFLDRPALGFGTGTFAYVFPAYHLPVKGGMASLYAHNYILQFLAENGLMCGALWFGIIFFSVKHMKGPARWAVLAAFLHSLVDFGFSIPSNFWLFCWLLSHAQKNTKSSSTLYPEPDRGHSGEPLAPVALRGCITPTLSSFYWRIPAGLLLLSLAVWAASWITVAWRTQKLTIAATAAYEAGDKQSAVKNLEDAGRLDPDNALVPSLRGKMLFAEALHGKDRAVLLESAVWIEKAAVKNPFRPSTWTELESIYAAEGETRLAQDVLKRRAAFIKWR
ncbi:MAG: O-antigen ligase family protein [bacterium]